MNNSKAMEVLHALVQGIDPETGDELPKNSVLHKADVLRALLAAVSALEATAARALRRAALPESVGKSWSDEEEQQLRDEFSGSEPLELIAAKHGRTIRAIEARLEKIGLLTADQRKANTSSFLGAAHNESVDE
jgi:hypothetical protein